MKKPIFLGCTLLLGFLLGFFIYERFHTVTENNVKTNYCYLSNTIESQLTAVNTARDNWNEESCEIKKVEPIVIAEQYCFYAPAYQIPAKRNIQKTQTFR